MAIGVKHAGWGMGVKGRGTAYELGAFASIKSDHYRGWRKK
jgi:hypothetical protein